MSSDLFGFGSSSSSSTFHSSPYAPMAAWESGLMFNESNQLFSALLNNIMKALSGQYMQIPLIRSALSRSMGATNSAYQNTLSSFARAGLGNDPLSQGVLGNILMQGREQESQIPSQIAMSLLGMAPGLLSTGFGTNIGALRGALTATTGQSSQSSSLYSSGDSGLADAGSFIASMF